MLADDADLYARLRKLIAADAAAEHAHFLGIGGFFDAALQGAEEEAALPDLSGEHIGAWALQSLLGAGGSGQVWLAQRCDGLHDAVAALKLLRTGGQGTHTQKRFEREGRVLARLRHAHIARLLDAGRSELSGRAVRYLVLEYIDGERIDRWCDHRKAPIEARLRLFLQVCDAVAYAHANLVVHRDLKPSNILVQADGEVKLLDFGVAKLLADEDDEARGELTELTRLGGAPFTPEYAAPEQFEEQPATVATDVYSLGVVLYLLLAGRRPYGNADWSPRDFARAAIAGASRRLAHSLDDATQDIQSIANARGTGAAQLKRLLRGDLDTILTVALKKNPRERYASVQAFADDLRRYLERKPIRARADGRMYRLRMFVARHAVGVGLSLASLLILVAATGTLLVQSQRLKVEVERSNAIKEFLLDAFRSAEPYASGGAHATDAVTMLHKASRELDGRPGVDDDTRAETLATFAGIFHSLGRYAEARDGYAKSEGIYRRLYGTDSPKALQVEGGDIANEWFQGNVDGLMPRIDHLLVAIGEKPVPELQDTRWTALDGKACVADLVGDLDSARVSAERYSADVRAVAGTENYRYSHSLWRRATIALDAGAPRSAAQLIGEVAAIDRRLGLPAAHPGLVTDLQTITDVLVDFGNYADAETIARASLRLRQREFGSRHHTVAETLWDNAVIAGELGHEQVAEADFAAALDVATEVFQPHARALASIHYDYGIHLLGRSRLTDAAAQFASCIQTMNDTADWWHYQRAACIAGAAFCAARNGDASAIATLDRLIEEERAHASREFPMALWLRARLAAEGGSGESRARVLAWLDEALRVLDGAGRGGSHLARDIDATRRALGAPPAVLHPESGHELVDAATEIIAAAK
ncbi:serine/threonine-protein kinase [Rudaea sp.]|uniref:serine/threonine-protein kinase n=1 Tax=Rudaea sp. TaxID=2136325 RepID=UPI002ED22A40